MNNKIVITTGNPNGIGAEITIKALNELDMDVRDVVIISNKKILNFYGKLDKNYEIIEIPYQSEIFAGKDTKECGEFSVKSLIKACELKGKAIVTAPVSKNSMYLAGYDYNGQTEVLQKYLGHDNQSAEMLFVAGNFRVLLLTRHVALKDIHLNFDEIVSKILNLNGILQSKFHVKNPKLALCGLNPHAGEKRILGLEESDILIPAVQKLRNSGVNITNPLPADTLFHKSATEYLTNSKTSTYDCIIANYHDQGLIPIKTVAGIKTVNTTIGLDVIRTSPGHGTAFDIAGKNIADASGMIEAIKLAQKL